MSILFCDRDYTVQANEYLYNALVFFARITEFHIPSKLDTSTVYSYEYNKML